MGWHTVLPLSCRLNFHSYIKSALVNEISPLIIGRKSCRTPVPCADTLCMSARLCGGVLSVSVEAALCKAWVVPQREDVFLLLLHTRSQKWANSVRFFLAQEQPLQLHPRHQLCLSYSEEEKEDGAGTVRTMWCLEGFGLISGVVSRTNLPGHDPGRNEYHLLSCVTSTSDVYVKEGFLILLGDLTAVFEGSCKV